MCLALSTSPFPCLPLERWWITKARKGHFRPEHENQRLSSLFYYARKKGPNHHYTAGNQNDGLQYAASINGDLADFVAFLDADMIPDPDWLRALLPHLSRNPKIAFATLLQVRNPISGHQERTHLCLALLRRPFPRSTSAGSGTSLRGALAAERSLRCHLVQWLGLHDTQGLSS